MTTALQVDSYDPDKKFELIKSVILKKKDSDEPFVKQDNAEGLLAQSQAATNGHHLLLFTGNDICIFDMSTGNFICHNALANRAQAVTCYEP